MKSVDSEVKGVLEERGKVYGDYEKQSIFRAKIMLDIQERYKETHGIPMSFYDMVRIYDIVNKLSRLAVTPNHRDTWVDIAGYANLTVQTIDKERNPNV